MIARNVESPNTYCTFNNLALLQVRFIDIVAGLAVTAEGLIVAVDSVTPTVFILSEEGDLMSWFDCSECMREPSDIAISGKLKARVVAYLCTLLYKQQLYALY